VGAATVFCSNLANKRFLATALGVSAGVMLYVSFVEIFASKAIHGFEDAGYTDKEALRYATFCFFGGMLLLWILDKVVHLVMQLGSMLGKWRAARRGAALELPSSRTSSQSSASTAAVPTPAAAADPEAGALNPAGPVTFQAMDRTSNTQRTCTCGGCTCHHRAGAASSSAASPDVDVVLLAAGLGGCSHGHGHDHGGAAVQVPKGEPADMADILSADHHASLARTGLLAALAIGLHNFPEGLATFVATLAQPTAGVAIAVAIALHNIPEGIVVGMPIYYATGSKWKGFMWGCISGLSEPLGALLGYAILRGSDADPLVYALMFGLVAGMMVYISITELIPTALKFDPDGVYTCRGAVAGMLVMAASLLLFGI